jgi:hypothetical protein
MARLQTVAPPVAPTAQAPGAPQAGRWMQSVHADVTVPFDAAAITGALVTALLLLVVGCVIYWQRVPFVAALPALVLGALGIWLTTTLAFWFQERRDIKTTWWRAEERDQLDYDGDGQIGRPEALQVRLAGDAQQRQTAEDLMQQRLEEFVARLYNADKRTTLAIRRLGFTERERTDFIRELRAAGLIQAERGGKAAAWNWVYDDPQQTIALARKRIIWRIPSSPSSSSAAK